MNLGHTRVINNTRCTFAGITRGGNRRWRTPDGRSVTTRRKAQPKRQGNGRTKPYRLRERVLIGGKRAAVVSLDPLYAQVLQTGKLVARFSRTEIRRKRGRA